MRREPPLAKVLTRQPGTKESRYMHLMGGDSEPATTVSVEQDFAANTSITNTADFERIDQLETEVNALRRELETLREQFAAFQKQFQ
jgi:hypothetical protein